MRHTCLCAIVKDEDPFLREWLLHHYAIGFEHFILYDNESAVPLTTSLADFVAAGVVTVRPVVGKSMQIPCYNECLQRDRDAFRWIAFFDLDEFLILKQDRDVRLLLQDYEAHGGLAAHWVPYGSAGCLGRPAGLVLENYQEAFTDPGAMGLHVKCIVQPKRASHAHNAHLFRFRAPGDHCVDENGLPATCPILPFTAKRVQLNHYHYKSQQDYEEKTAKGRADVFQHSDTRSADCFIAQTRRAVHRERPLDRTRLSRLKGAMAAPMPQALRREFDVDTNAVQAMGPATTLRRAQRALAMGRAEEALLLTVLLGHVFGEDDAHALDHAPAWERRTLQSLCLMALRRFDEAFRLACDNVADEPSMRSFMYLLKVHLARGERAEAAAVARYITLAGATCQARQAPDYEEFLQLCATHQLLPRG